MRLIDGDVLMEAINTWPKFGVDERDRIVPWNEGYVPYIHLRDVVIAITGMPTIEPERKTGKWEQESESLWKDRWSRWKCSACGKHVLIGVYDDPIKAGLMFCPKCGATMEETE